MRIPFVLRWWLLGAAAALSICLTSPALANFLQGKYSLSSRLPGDAGLPARRGIFAAAMVEARLPLPVLYSGCLATAKVQAGKDCGDRNDKDDDD